MSVKYNIEDLEEEYIGKTFNWLTVISVFRSNGVLYFKCRCKCGKDTVTRISYVISNHTKSCGCYSSSKEHKSELSKFWKDNQDKVKERAKKQSEWYKNNQDKAKEYTAKYCQWCKNNPDKVKERTDKIKQWCKDNPDKLVERGAKYSQWCKDNPDKKKQSTHNKEITYLNRRAKLDYSSIANYVHPDDLNDLLSGKLKARSLIRTKCPLCDNFDYHTLHNVFTFSTEDIKYRGNIYGKMPICCKCQSSRSSSMYEQEIADYISIFYNGECIRNDRSVLNGKELDLYYPEKKIAIEFNGDYWHDENHKPKNYHYDKYILCKENGIILVSIFETYWLTNKNTIKSYLSDLFSNKENTLSFNSDLLLNNNYPSPNTMHLNGDHIDEYYIHSDKKIFTCGYTRLK